MATAFYTATFRKQNTGSALAWKNCGAAAGAMLVDQGSLGNHKPTPDAFRARTGDFSGGLFIGQIGGTVEKYGVGVTVFDANDGLDWADLVAFLKVGRFAVVNGDYDQVPYALKGDKSYNDYHAVIYEEIVGDKIRVGDGLNDGRRPGIYKGWVWWPLSVAKNYVERFDRQVPGTGLHAAVLDRKRLKSRPISPNTRVRSAPTRSAAEIGTFGGSATVIWGDTVTGESVGGSRVWYRVWLPSAAKIGFCHSSVVTRV